MNEARSFEEYSLRDVLLVVTCLGHKDQCVTGFGVCVLRNCLNRALRIFQSLPWGSIYLAWFKRMVRNWSYSSRNAELAVLFALLENWPAILHACDDPEVEEMEAFTGMSITKIISVIAFLVTDRRDVSASYVQWLSCVPELRSTTSRDGN